MYSAEALVPDVARSFRRFAIAWRNRVQRSIHDVAVLDVESGIYRFQYLPDVVDSVDGFRPFIGFPDVGRVYESQRLWPFFDLRVMDRKRPDYPQYLRWLGLAPGADRLDVLSRSGGEQKGDTVSLAEAPHIETDGTTHAVFLIRGVSYAIRAHNSVSVAEQLGPGEALDVIEDTTNEANPKALLLVARGRPIGWVPDLLIDYVDEVRNMGGSISVLQNNGAKAPWHVRLLARISGSSTPGWSPFTGDPWPALADRGLD